jgi:hypothetical protein
MRRSFPDEVTCDRCGCHVADHHVATLHTPMLRMMADEDQYDLCTQCWRDIVAIIQKGTR